MNTTEQLCQQLNWPNGKFTEDQFWYAMDKVKEIIKEELKKKAR